MALQYLTMTKYQQKMRQSALIIDRTRYGSITCPVVTLYANSKRCRCDINQPWV